MNLEKLYISMRWRARLKEHGIDTVEKLIQLNLKQLREIDGISDKGIAEIAWSCVQFLNGNLYERIQEIDDYAGRKKVIEDAFAALREIRKLATRK